MSRFFTKTGTHPFWFYPFANIERDPLATTEVAVGFEKACEWWWRVRSWRITVTWTIDPATSDTGATTYTREILVNRLLYEGSSYGSTERALMYPGAEIDAKYPYGRFGTEESPNFAHDFYRAFQYQSTLILLGEDDVFEGTALECTMSLFDGGVTVNAVTGETAVTVKLRLQMVYDDGSEGVLYVQTAPTELPDDCFEIDVVASLDSEDLEVVSADSGGSLTYHFGGVAPIVTIEPEEWFSYTGVTVGAVVDSGTGVKLRNPLERAL